jgi:lipopolysaccharide export system permease protein
MKILHTYVTRELLVTMLFALAVFTFILLAVKILPEIMRLLGAGQVPADTVLRSIGLMLPQLLILSLPMALLSAVLLVFGRFSADNEINAMRTSGVDLLSIASPVLLISVLLVGICLYINCHLGPECRLAYRRLLVNAGLRDPAALIEAGQYSRSFPGYIVHAAERKSNTLFQLNVYVLDPTGRVFQNLRADRAEVQVRSAEKKLELTLFNLRGEVCDPDEPVDRRKWRAGIRADSYPLTFDLTKLLAETHSRREPKYLVISELFDAISELRQQGISTAPLWLEVHKRVAGSFACLAFALIAVPLGMRTQRRETSIGVALSLALAAGYYMFLIVASALEHKPHCYPELIVWAPNIVYEAFGLWMLWRASRV